jgi:hypothetical protein
MSKVVVGGAGGFIGGNLIGELRKQAMKQIRAVDIKPLSKWQGVALIRRPQCAVRLGNSTTFSGISTVRW